jgi:hypothetical protein
VLAEAAQQHETDDGPGAARAQGQSVDVETDLEASQPERQQEDLESLQPSDDRHGGQPQQHLGMGDRLKARQVRRPIVHVRIARGRLREHLLGSIDPGSGEGRQPKPRHRRTDKDERVNPQERG